jgi:hypothetical protein
VKAEFRLLGLPTLKVSKRIGSDQKQRLFSSFLLNRNLSRAFPLPRLGFRQATKKAVRQIEPSGELRATNVKKQP